MCICCYTGWVSGQCTRLLIFTSWHGIINWRVWANGSHVNFPIVWIRIDKSLYIGIIIQKDLVGKNGDLSTMLVIRVEGVTTKTLELYALRYKHWVLCRVFKDRN